MASRSFAEILEDVTDESRAMEAPLAERLAAVAAEVDRLSPQFAAVVARMVAHLRDNSVGLNAPRPGETMPAFALPDESGAIVTLAGLLQNGPLVVSFNRGHWCPYCRLNVDSMARIVPDVAALGGQIVVITPEIQRYGRALKAYARASFPVLTDIDGGYALATGLLFRVGEEERAAMCLDGYDIAPYQGSDAWLLPIPATFLLNRDGLVVTRHIDPDYRHRMAAEDLLACLSSLR